MASVLWESWIGKFTNDPRSTDELVRLALIEQDEELAWGAVGSLHWRGSLEVLQHAKVLATSHSSRERRLAADILGQLGVPDRTFPSECMSILRSMLLEGEEDFVLESVLIGLSHQNDVDSIPLATRYVIHPIAQVRHAVVLVLSGHQVPLAIESLIQLSNDSCEHVRDWATCGLGTLIEANSPQIREALGVRLDDVDDNTRVEAIVGLARRKDNRVVAALKKELRSDCIGTLIIEAAELISSNELYLPLVALRNWWELDSDLLERAVAASKM